MIDKKTVENDGGILSWEHVSDYGFKFELTLYTNNNYLDFEVIRLEDHRKVLGECKEYKRWEEAVEIFERTKDNILNPDCPGHDTLKRGAKKFYPLRRASTADRH